MNYIVLDLEWNQPLSKQRTIRKPITLRGEIIQIGAVKLTEKLELVDTFSVMIAPKYYTKMNKKVTELTEINDQDIQGGIPFQEAINDFRKWCGEDSILLTWGPEDMYNLEDNLIIHGMDYDWLPEDFDAQVMFDDIVTNETRNYALSYAMYVLDVKPLRCHDALNDAINTAQVIRKIDAYESVREYLQEVA